MTFYFSNFIYIGIWFFVFLIYKNGITLDYLCPNYEGVKKINLKTINHFFVFNKKYENKMWIKSFLVQSLSYLLFTISIKEIRSTSYMHYRLL